VEMPCNDANSARRSRLITCSKAGAGFLCSHQNRGPLQRRHRLPGGKNCKQCVSSSQSRVNEISTYQSTPRSMALPRTPHLSNGEGQWHSREFVESAKGTAGTPGTWSTPKIPEVFQTVRINAQRRNAFSTTEEAAVRSYDVGPGRVATSPVGHLDDPIPLLLLRLRCLILELDR